MKHERKRPPSPVAKVDAFLTLRGARCNRVSTTSECFEAGVIDGQTFGKLNSKVRGAARLVPQSTYPQHRPTPGCLTVRSSAFILASTRSASALFGASARRSLTASLSSARVAPSTILFRAISKAFFVSIATPSHAEGRQHMKVQFGHSCALHAADRGLTVTELLLRQLTVPTLPTARDGARY